MQIRSWMQYYTTVLKFICIYVSFYCLGADCLDAEDHADCLGADKHLDVFQAILGRYHSARETSHNAFRTRVTSHNAFRTQWALLHIDFLGVQTVATSGALTFSSQTWVTLAVCTDVFPLVAVYGASLVPYDAFPEKTRPS